MNETKDIFSDRTLIEKYALRSCLKTYDPYDIWITAFGVKSKRGYFKCRFTGLLPVVFLTVFDSFINNRFRLFYKKREFSVVRAFAALIAMQLYTKSSDKKYLWWAKEHIDWLLSNSCKGYSGYCWGFGAPIVISADMVYDDNMPFVTNVPYALEAIIQYYQVTQCQGILNVINSVFNFLDKDLQVMEDSENQMVLSYGALKDRIVTNANAYAMYMYALFLPFFPEKENYIKDKIFRLFNFIKGVQNSDGSWFYAPYDNKSFIDCFHTCFILKNLLKTNCLLSLPYVADVLESGYRYLKDSFYNSDKSLFKRFSKTNKPNIVAFDLYDNAEALNLAILMNDRLMIKDLRQSIRKSFVVGDDIFSQIDVLGLKHNKNMLRWAVMPYLYSLSCCYTDEKI